MNLCMLPDTNAADVKRHPLHGIKLLAASIQLKTPTKCTTAKYVDITMRTRARWQTKPQLISQNIYLC